MNAPTIEDAFVARVQRALAADRLNVLDLFSGCGGMTLGFARAGFESLAGIEIDRHAARSHALNFHGELQESDPDRFERMAAARDITQTDPAALLAELGYPAGTEVDVIVGGPPCPAFTRVGRAKLREVHQNPEAFRDDPRWMLYLPYLQFVKTLRPLALVMENVPDVMNFGGLNVAEDVAHLLDIMGYRAAYSLLNASHYGVPQMRDRFILIAFDARLDVAPVFPQPTHQIELPSGYHSSRTVAMQLVGGQAELALGTAANAEGNRFVKPLVPAADVLPAVTIREALSDLPVHEPGPRGARRLNESVPYRPHAQPSAYAHDMRTWPGFSTQGRVTAHVTRALGERDRRLFERMQPGDDYPAAHRIATELFNAKKVTESRMDEVALASLKADYVPPYDASKFPNKWRKMDPSKPARTLMAHLGKDSYTHIHYDDAQRRVLTVREAARLQSFPDGFQFSGTMNPGFRQIGNAVPPLLAFAIARVLKEGLDESMSAVVAQADVDV